MAVGNRLKEYGITEKSQTFLKGWIFYVILLALVVRAFGLVKPLVRFEGGFFMIAEALHTGGTFNFYHPPLSYIFYFITTSAFGVTIFGMRMMPYIVGICILIVSYFFSKEMYGERTAIITAFLIAVIFQAVWSSVYIDIDGNVLTLFLLLTLFGYYMMCKGGEIKWVFLTSIFFGLSMLSKYPAILIVPVIFVADLIRYRLKNFKNIIFITAGGIALFSLFPLLSFATGHAGLFWGGLSWGQTNLSTTFLPGFSEMMISTGKLLVFLFQHLTPLIPVLFLFALIFRRRSDESVLYVFVIAYLIFYGMIMFGGLKSRYILILMPAMCIISSKVINDALRRFEKTDAIKFAGFFIIFILLILGMNSYGVHESYNSFTYSNFDLIQKNAFFWYNGYTSFPFAIHLHSLIFVVSLSFILLLLAVFFRKDDKVFKEILIILVAVGLAFNSFILFESFNQTVGPSLQATLDEMTVYFKDNVPDNELYSFDYAIYLRMLPIYRDKINLVEIERCEGLKDMEEGFELTFIDIQFFENPHSDCVRSVLEMCSFKKGFDSNGFENFGQIYVCNK